MFIRYFLELDDPFDRVEAALLADPSTWVPGMARAAGELGERLLTEVGFAVDEERRMDKEVEILFGEAYRSASAKRLPMMSKTSAPPQRPLIGPALWESGGLTDGIARKG